MEYVILIISLLAIVWGADNLVNGAVAIARRYKISDFVIGAIIVGIGTSCPEMVVSAYGALMGNVDVAIGNVVGSNIFNVLSILGFTALLYPVKVSKENKRFDLPVCIFISVVALFLAFNFFNGKAISIGRIDGAIFLLFFADDLVTGMGTIHGLLVVFKFTAVGFQNGVFAQTAVFLLHEHQSLQNAGSFNTLHNYTSLAPIGGSDWGKIREMM